MQISTVKQRTEVMWLTFHLIAIEFSAFFLMSSPQTVDLELDVGDERCSGSLCVEGRLDLAIGQHNLKPSTSCSCRADLSVDLALIRVKVTSVAVMVSHLSMFSLYLFTRVPQSPFFSFVLW